MKRRAKIVCTIGPASRDEAKLGRLVEAGMDVARMNFSHGTHEGHREVLERIRRLSGEVAVMQDLKGPKIRVGFIEGEGVRLVDGEPFTLTAREVAGGSRMAGVSYDGLASDVSPGDSIFLADGTIHLEVESVAGGDVLCRVLHGGVLSTGKGVNIPGVGMNVPALTGKDLNDLAYGLELGVDLVALSFVTGPDEVEDLKERVRRAGSKAWIVAKIEKREALESLGGIIAAADALMIARGDLGVEIPVEDVPIVQKEIIRACRGAGKPVITATQMLESMVREERPTRAEASDVANAIIDGSDAVMLSAETATGDHPEEAVRIMGRIAARAEEYRVEQNRAGDRSFEGGGPIGEGEDHKTDMVSLGAVTIAEEIGASAIACLTHTGRTARMISRYRPRVPIVALTDNPHVSRLLHLVWGVESLRVETIEDTERILEAGRERLREMGFRGRAVLTAGVPTGLRGPTNTVNVLDL
ncbi:MAG TPA: pyruvate kinase [Candidatus Eisenbacteria bacterium]|uniref:Pyruvate kinase n=1 Tax=Eiseniibacteriota bacterium TaxID=2212470 RepID=A0A7V2ATJ8_UNCEI|nr:pyruvate kinase [Candidatus Eisenbacteria bacterium]